MRAADALAATMLSHGVDRLFCVPGESYLALLDALHDRSELDVIVARHEGGSALMAVADAKLTGRPGLCLVSRGPGAMNAALGIHVAEQDAVPLIVIVGQVARAERGRGAFQEVDYAKTFSDCAKAVWEVSAGDKLAETFRLAWQRALAGTPGPVVIAVAEDAFEDDVPPPGEARSAIARSHPDPAAIAGATDLLARAHRPLVIAGGAVGTAYGRRMLAAVAARHRLPVVTSYKRQDLFDNASPLYAGHLGFKIPADRVGLLGEADLVLAIGTRLGDVTTQGYAFPPHDVPLVHAYPDPVIVGRNHPAAHGIAGDCEQLLAALTELPVASPGLLRNRTSWAERLHAGILDDRAYVSTHRTDGLEFGAVVQAVAARAERDAIVVLDAGNFASWVHRLWSFRPENTLLGALGGAMGLAVPGAVAAALRRPERQILAFVGDGGFMMTGAELATAVACRAKLTIFIAQNCAYGTIRLHQELSFPHRTSGTALGPIDFAALARACGAEGLTIREPGEVTAVVDRALACPGPCVVDVRTSLEAISATLTIDQARARANARAMPATLW